MSRHAWTWLVILENVINVCKSIHYTINSYYVHKNGQRLRTRITYTRVSGQLEAMHPISSRYANVITIGWRHSHVPFCWSRWCSWCRQTAPVGRRSDKRHRSASFARFEVCNRDGEPLLPAMSDHVRQCKTVYDIPEGVRYTRECTIYTRVYDIHESVRYTRGCTIYTRVYHGRRQGMQMQGNALAPPGIWRLWRHLLYRQTTRAPCTSMCGTYESVRCTLRIKRQNSVAVESVLRDSHKNSCFCWHMKEKAPLTKHQDMYFPNTTIISSVCNQDIILFACVTRTVTRVVHLQRCSASCNCSDAARLHVDEQNAVFFVSIQANTIAWIDGIWAGNSVDTNHVQDFVHTQTLCIMISPCLLG